MMNKESDLLTQQVDNINLQENQIIIERLIDFESNQADAIHNKYLQFEKLYPNNIDTLITLGYIEIQYHSNFSEAIKYFQKCISLNCNEIDAYLGLCWIIIQDRQYKKLNQAYDYIEHCLKIKKDYWRIYYIKSSLHFLSGKMKEGLDILEQGLNLNSNSIQLQSLKIQFHLSNKSFKKANEITQKVINLNTENDPFILLRIGGNYQFNESYSDKKLANYYFKQAYQLNSKNLITLSLLLHNSNNSEDIEEYKIYLDKALSLYPNHTFLLNQLAIMEKDENEKLKLLQESLKSDDENIYSYYDIAQIYNEQQEYDEVLKQYYKVLTFQPDDVKSIKNIGYTLCFRKSQYGKALQYYKKLIKTNSIDADTSYEISGLYYYIDDYDKALYYVKKCLQLDPTYESALYVLFDCKCQI